MKRQLLLWQSKLDLGNCIFSTPDSFLEVDSSNFTTRVVKNVSPPKVGLLELGSIIGGYNTTTMATTSFW
jgi:hypothetical protein